MRIEQFSDEHGILVRVSDEVFLMTRDEARSHLLRLRELLAENAKLRDEIDQWHRLTAGIELPEYPITEFQPKDLERENDRLRELVRCLVYAEHPSDRATLIANAADMLAELGVDA